MPNLPPRPFGVTLDTMDAEALQQADQELDGLGVSAERIDAILAQFSGGAGRALAELDAELESLAAGVALAEPPPVSERRAPRGGGAPAPPPAPAAAAPKPKRTAMEEALAAVADSDLPPPGMEPDDDTSQVPASDVRAMIAARTAALAQPRVPTPDAGRSSLELDFADMPALADERAAPHLTAEELFADAVVSAPAAADALASVDDAPILVRPEQSTEESLAELLESDIDAPAFDPGDVGRPAPVEEVHAPLSDDYDDAEVRTTIASAAEVASLMAEALESVREKSSPPPSRRPASVPPRASTRPEDWGPDPFAAPVAVPPAAALPAEASVDVEAGEFELVIDDDALLIEEDEPEVRQAAGSHIGPPPTPPPVERAPAAEAAPPGSIPPPGSLPPPGDEAPPEGGKRKSFFGKLFGK